LKASAAFSCGLSGATLLATRASAAVAVDSLEEGPNIIGPRDGFAPYIGTLVSMLEWMRSALLQPVQGLTREQLDYLHDPKANTIGALLLHLAATERLYQLNTFEGKKWADWDEKTRKKWGVPMQLGEEARKTIKGNDLGYYLDILKETRAQTLVELRKRDDAWLMKVDRDWAWGPTNNYCKWFHVCEHESNHNGQIKWLRRRLPGATGNYD
jgi:uncharacterized damage-inducible protein DinB